MPRRPLDHITVTAPTLAAGAEFITHTLGVVPQPGGEHPRMGTHNLLLRLGDGLFLEVIAPDPAAPAPSRPRWFGLDHLRPDTPPALSTWVARTTDIHTAAAASPEPLGPVEPMRRGALHWLITIPVDGTVPLDGVGPALIEWADNAHPADRLPDQGLSLAGLELQHPEPARVTRLLAALQLDGPLSVAALPAHSRPYLVARINTPHGRRTLSAPQDAPG